MALIRTLLSLLLILSLCSAVGALVMHSIVRSKYNDDENQNRFLDNVAHGFGLAGAGLGIVASFLGLLFTWTRNLHRRPLTHIYNWFALLTLIVIGGAIGTLALYHNTSGDLPGSINAALALDCALAFFLWLATMVYIHKSMEEFAVGHK